MYGSKAPKERTIIAEGAVRNSRLTGTPNSTRSA